MTTAYTDKTDRAEAIERLQKLISRDDTVYTILRHVSSSGMSRAIDCYLIKDNRPYWIGRSAATAAGYKWNSKHDGAQLGGCGMDMGFALVHDLSRALFDGDGYAIKQSWL